jgi:tRNA 2-thiouridine synthesizing protein A
MSRERCRARLFVAETSPERCGVMNEPVADVEWDAGDLGCGPLLLDLRKRLRTMPGQVLKLISVDPGSPEDLPVWCRLSHNELLHHDPATKSFWIRSRLDWG